LLFFTSGIVVLTLVVNGTTVESLMNRLGMTKMSMAKETSRWRVLFVFCFASAHETPFCGAC
jgi:hypothetical protein